jgi:hypothetical protein
MPDNAVAHLLFSANMRPTTYAVFVLFLFINLFPSSLLAAPTPITIPRLGKAAVPGKRIIGCVLDFYRL